MSKRKKIFFLLFSIILLVFFCDILSFISFQIGKTFFNKKQYNYSTKCFLIAQKFKPLNPQYKEYYTRSIIMLPMTYDIQKNIFNTINNSLGNPAVIVADERLEKFKTNILSHFDKNYIQVVPLNNKIVRWDENKFPLKVYIAPLNSQSDQIYINLIKNAFTEWDQKLNKFFSFEYVKDEQTANIIISFNLNRIQQQNTNFYIAAETLPKINNNILEKMIIDINLKNDVGEYLTEKIFYSSILHEIGHALGIMGHSDNNENLMSPVATDKITNEDLNTIRLLYLLVPDISNTNPSLINKDKRIYAPIILGKDENFNNEQYIKAITYIKNFPQMPEGWLELAIFYYQIGNYPKAIKSLLQAKKYNLSENNLFLINSNLALIYFEMKEYNNARLYANEALKKKNDNDLKIINLLSEYKLGLKKETIQKLNQIILLEKYNINAYLALTDIYFEQKDYLKGISTLRKLIKNNPKVKNDERLKRYKLILI